MPLTREVWDSVSCDGLFLVFDTHAHLHHGDGSGALTEAKAHVNDCEDCFKEGTHLDPHGDLIVHGEEITVEADTGILECGGCSAQLTVTRAQWENDSRVPCECGEGADLDHARRHSAWAEMSA